MSGERKSNWALLAILPAILSPMLVVLSKHYGAEIRASVHVWQPIAAQVTLVLAGVVVLVAIWGGVHAYRGVKRDA